MSTTNSQSLDIQAQLNYCSLQDVTFFYICQVLHLFSDLIYNSSSPGSGVPTIHSVCTKENLVLCFDHINNVWKYDEFHVTLFKVFVTIVVVNLILIYIAWSYYGEKICDRFMKPTSQEVIEDLRKSVAQLKLPKDYSPRL